MKEKKTILVVDDMVQIRNILQFSLHKEGYDVILADNGADAIKQVSGDDSLFSKTVDLIILDIMMPRMDGYEVLGKLRSSDSTKDIPVIFRTAKAQKKDVAKGIEAGANDYLVKPFKLADLFKKIKQLTNDSL